MNQKIQLFSALNLGNLQDVMNEFLSHLQDTQVIDVSISHGSNPHLVYGMIRYKDYEAKLETGGNLS